MLEPKTFWEVVLFATVRIEAVTVDGRRSVGTGFLYEHRMEEEKSLPLLITNRHVVENTIRAKFPFHLAEPKPNADPYSKNAQVRPSGRSYLVKVDNPPEKFICHPNPDVDLCALPYGLVRTVAQSQGFTLFEAVFTEDVLLKEEDFHSLDAVEDVLLVGYPVGLWDEFNNLPIVRRGMTATHPQLDFNGQPVFLIDAACFPGSSGSPVILANRGWYHDKQTGTTHLGENRVGLLGVLFAGAVWQSEGKLVPTAIPTSIGSQVMVQNMAHLGFVIKAKEIFQLASHVAYLIQTGKYRA